MKSKSIFILLSLFSFFTIANAQIEGDSLFAEDQVVTIDLTFHQTSWWDSLEANYTTETYMKADLTLTTLQGSRSYTDVGVRLKGNSTYNHPNNKKPFKIDFNKYVSGQNYDGLKKLNFNNNFKDPSMMREKVFFDLCNDAGVPAPRVNFANVYFNGTLWGLYTMVEQIDDQFLDWAILDDNGNLFKAGDNFGGTNTPANLVYYDTAQASYDQRYELKTNETANDWSDLIALMDFINNSSATDFENHFQNHIEADEYLRSAALDNLFGNMDSYTESARNYYLYHNLTSGKWEWIKWDGNEAFGNYPAGGGGGPGGGSGLDLTTLAIDYVAGDRPLLQNVFNSQNLTTAYKNEMCFVLENYFNSAHVDPIIDSLKVLIQPSVYADPNKMYTDADFDTNTDSDITSSGGGPGGGTTYGLKSFVQQRYSYVTGVLDCNIYTGIEEAATPSVALYPNPASSVLNVSTESGPIQNVSVLNSTGAVVLQATPLAQKAALNINSLPAGLYFVRIETAHGSTTERVIIQK